MANDGLYTHDTKELYANARKKIQALENKKKREILLRVRKKNFSIMKKLWLNIRIFFTLLFKGLKNANDIAFTGNKDTDVGNGSSIEQQKEVQSVYKDMLKGEINTRSY